MLPRHIWSFCVKRVGINTGEPPKWVAPELRSVGTGCVADRMIHAPSHMCYPAKFGTSATRVFAYIEGNPKKWGLLGPRPHWGVRRCWPSKTKPHPHLCYQVCYQVKIGSAPSKGVCTNRREPQKLGSTGAPPPCGREVADTVEIHTCVILPNSVVRGHTVRALLRRSTCKLDSSRPAFQGHSMSSEPTRIDPPPVTYIP